MTQLQIKEEGAAVQVRDAIDAWLAKGQRFALLDRVGCFAVVICVLFAIGAAVTESWRVMGAFGVASLFFYWLATRFDSDLADDERLAFAREVAHVLSETDDLNDAVRLDLELRPHVAFAPEEKTQRADLGIRARYLQRWLTLRVGELEVAVTRQTIEDQHGIEVQSQTVTEWVEVLSPEASTDLKVDGLRWDDGCWVAEETVAPSDLVAVLRALGG